LEITILLKDLKF